MRTLTHCGVYLLCILLVLALGGCSPPEGTTTPAPTPTPAQADPEAIPTTPPVADTAPVPPPPAEPTPSSEPPLAAASSAGDPAPTPTLEEDEATQEDPTVFLNCPRPGDSLFLVFEHDVFFDAMGMAAIQQTVAAQAIELHCTEGGESKVGIESESGLPANRLPVTISGSAGTCSVGGSATLVPTVAGYCEEGIVWLTIWEEWQEYEMTITCDDSPPMPFALPDTGYKHAGPDDQGIDFWLVDEGVAVREFPFQGEGGSGFHRWTLYLDGLLVPNDVYQTWFEATH